MRDIVSDVMIKMCKTGENKSLIGYYEKTDVLEKGSLQTDQMIPAIPVKNDTDMGESAAGGLHEYANPALIEQEKRRMRNSIPGMNLSRNFPVSG